MFIKKITLLQNIKHGLWQSSKTLEDMAQQIQTSEGAIKVRLSTIANTKHIITPLDQKIDQYLLEHCEGWNEYRQKLVIKQRSSDE